MSGWWIHSLYQQGRIAELISWIFWVLLAITLHELAHGWAALWQGDDTPRRMRRMTLNPVVHMGPWSLLIFAVIGIAWGVMPTDPSRYRWGRKGRLFVAAAGPAMNLVLAFISLTALAFWQRFATGGSDLYANVDTFLWTGGLLNIVLAMFNMLPVPPLDGSQVLSGLSYRCYVWFQNPQSQTIGMFIVLALFITGAGSLFFTAAGAAAMTYVDLLTILLGGEAPLAGPY